MWEAIWWSLRDTTLPFTVQSCLIIHVVMKAQMTQACYESCFNDGNHHACSSALLILLQVLKCCCRYQCQIEGLGVSSRGSSYHIRAWAARYNTWLLMKLTPKGVVFSFLFFPITDMDCSSLYVIDDPEVCKIIQPFIKHVSSLRVRYVWSWVHAPWC